MELNVFNTVSRTKEVFKPIIPGKVSLYCCGPTVYNFAHVGNLRTYVFEDILRRTLEFAGYKVRHVMNITDVGHLSDDGDEGEDKMIKAARQKGMTVWDIAGMFTDAFFADTARLNIRKPMVVCKATDHIKEMIDLVQMLEANGYTYVADGNVYFDIAKFERYGSMALLDRQELRAGARVGLDSAKRNPGDFVLWFTKSKFEDQAMIWDSPWGKGYPGWHIECSAMSRKYLGDHFDIHCGGVDHIPVHHTNEIAQTECATGTNPWVNYWIHGEFLLMNKEKMAKSSGNFATLGALGEQGYHPLDYRFFLLQAHYRTQLNYSAETMAAAKAGRSSLLERVSRLLSAVPEGFNPAPIKSAPTEPDLADFVAAIYDDLNVPRAMAVLNGVFKRDEASVERKLELLASMDQIFGLDLIESARALLQKSSTDDFSPQERAEIESLIQERNDARKAKNFARSDEIRSLLGFRGIVLKDGASGTTFERS